MNNKFIGQHSDHFTWNIFFKYLVSLQFEVERMCLEVRPLKVYTPGTGNRLCLTWELINWRPQAAFQFSISRWWRIDKVYLGLFGFSRLERGSLHFVREGVTSEWDRVFTSIKTRIYGQQFLSSVNIKIKYNKIGSHQHAISDNVMWCFVLLLL